MASLPTATVDFVEYAVPVIPRDVAEHCEKHGLSGLLELAIEIAARHFTLAGPVEVELEIDVDTDEERLILNVPVAGTVEGTIKQYDDYSREWVERAPADSRLEIGLVPNIVGQLE